MFLILSRSRAGIILHRMSFRFRSTAWSASRFGSIKPPRSAMRGPSLPAVFFSHPTAVGLARSYAEDAGSSITMLVRLSVGNDL